MSEKYLGENSTPLLINQIKENCTQKRSTLPIASIDELGNTYQYTGTTSGSLVHGYFYECVSDGQDPATYSWQNVNVQPTAGNPTASGTTFDNTTSGLQATNVQDAIDEVEGRVDNIEEKVPSTATSSNKLVDHDSLGTAAFKDSTDRVSPNNTALVESQSVYSAINTALSSIYTPRGDITCAELTSDLLIEANVGNIYETSDSGTTTALFLQGAGVPIATGSNVGIISAGQGRILFNLMANAFDLTDYQKKDLVNTIEGSTTVEGALGALSTDKQSKDLATAVESATTVEGALGALSSNKQAKTLTTSVESQTTVEGALGALSTNKATQAEVNDIVNVLGAKNLLKNEGVNKTTTDVTFTVNADKSVTAVASPSSGAWNFRLSKFTLKAGTYILTDGIGDSDIFTQIVNESESTALATTKNKGLNGHTFTIANDTTVIGRLFWEADKTFNVTLYPMLRLASDPDNTYVPYAMTNRQMTPYVQAISNPNLLDNPWFTVNQRGESSYNTSGAYTVDRWKLYNGAVTVNSDKSITITTSQGKSTQLQNRIDPEASAMLHGKQVTLSAIVNNVLYKQTFIYEHYEIYQSKININDTWVFDFRNIPNDGDSGHLVRFFTSNASDTSSITVKAVKLELGSVSTLAMDTAPNYATELLKCQRYFERNNWYDWCCVNCTMAGQLNFGMSYPFLVKKRVSPTFAFNVPGNTGIGNGYVKDLTDGTNIPASEVVLQQPGAWNFRMIQMKLTHSSFTVGHTYAVGVGDNTVDISADL